MTKHPEDVHRSCSLTSLALGILALVASCSGEPNAPTCGDAVRDPDEACDDGNRESGDACTSTCQIPGTVLECTTLLDGTQYYDDVQALLPLSDLSFVAGGAQRVGEDEVGWIGRYDDSDAPIWLTWPPPADKGANSIIDVGEDSSAGYWALLNRGGDEELIHLDTSGQVDTRLFLPDIVQPAGLGVSAARLLVVEGHIWLVGSGSGGDSDGPDVWVGRFDIETQVLSTIFSEDYAGFSDGAWAIAQSNSEIAIAATVDTGPSTDGDTFLTPHSNVLVIRFDLQGQEVGRNLIGAVDPEIATIAYTIAADGNDGWVVGGDQHTTGNPFDVPQKAWVTRVHPGEGWTWTWTSDGPPAGGAVVKDIAVSDRELVAVGQAYGEGTPRSWLIGIGLDGAPHWEQDFAEGGYAASEVIAVVFDRDLRLRTANSAWNPGGTSLLQSCLVTW